MQICSVLSNNVLLSDYYKKKWFKTKVAQTSVLVEYTKSSESMQKDGNDISSSLDLSEETPRNEEDFIFIRKFASVADFIKRVRTLDTVLENIESFSLSVYGNGSKSSSKMTPGAPTPG